MRDGKLKTGKSGAKSTNFIPTKLDFTEPTDEQAEISERYEVIGLPTILFLDEKGEEIEGSRITGFLEASDFIQHLRSLREQ